LRYNNQTLSNKEAKLRDIFVIPKDKDEEAKTVYEVEVVKKGEFD
jgi:hypothetical protein